MVLDDLERRKALLAAIIDSSDDAIISKNLNSEIISWNKSAERMFGYTEEEVIGRHIDIIIPDDRKTEEDMIIGNLRKGKKINQLETIRVAKSGMRLNVSINVSPIRSSTSVIVGASTIIHDTTQRKRDQEIIEQYANRLEKINAISKTISAQLDINTILQKVTDVTTELSGAAFGAFFYNTIDAKGEAYMLYTLSGAPREAFEKFGMPRNTDVFKLTFSGEAVVRSDDITKDPRYGRNHPHYGMPKGHLPVVSYLAVPVMSQGGVVIGGLFFGHPRPAMFREEHEYLVTAIASQAAIALDNAKLYDEIRILNSKKDDFIGFASHELKTPLTTISGYVQLAKLDSELSSEALDKIEKQVIRINGIIDELLNVSKIRAGRLELDLKKTSLNSIVHDAIETAKPDDHLITFELPSENFEVTVDAQKMSQVVTNVLTNAMKYSEKGSVIKISGILVDDQIEITIEDHGIGISPEYIDKIFNQFYRVPKSKDRQGLGLGLYISREIVEAHKGKIWAESKEEAGSVFHINFPVETTVS